MKISKMTDAELAAQARDAAKATDSGMTIEVSDLLTELADRLSPDESKHLGIPVQASGDDDADEAMKRGLAEP